VIELGCRLSFATEAHQRFPGICMTRQNALQRYNAARVALARPINYAHSAAPNFFQNLIIA
jgi:hypothetical protein